MIRLNHGDANIPVTLYFEDGEGNRVSLTGATITSKMVGTAGVVSIASSSHVPDADQVANIGKCILTLTSAEIAALKLGVRDIKSKVVQGSVTLTYTAVKAVEVLPETPEN